MAQLPEETITTVLNLQRRLLAIIDQAAAIDFLILEQYGETEATLIDLEQLQNIKERADTYYTRFYRLLRQIAQAQTLSYYCYARFTSAFNRRGRGYNRSLSSKYTRNQTGLEHIMSDKPQPPDIEKVKQTSAKIQEICKRADANILILDDIIAQLEEDNRSSPVYQYRLKRAKQLLNFPENQSQKIETHQDKA